MNKKNTIILSIISIFTLVVSLIEATYSYLSSDITEINNSNVSASTGKLNSYFFANTDGSLDIDVNLYQMNQIDSSDTLAPEEQTKTAKLTASLLAPTNGVIGKCTFDILLVWDNASDIYEKSKNVANELTISATSSVFGSQILSQNEDEYNIYINNAKSLNEINIDKLSWQENNEEKYAVLINDATISNYNPDHPTTFEYLFTLKFYNATVNQNSQMQKIYNSHIKIDNLNCN